MNASTRRAAIPNASRARRTATTEETAIRRGTGRTVRGRETRQKLLDAARTIFERDGFLRARIADICDEAGISHGSFYTYFLSKEEILTEIVDAVELDLLTVPPTPGATNPVARIEAANRHYLEMYRANASILTVINQVATFDADVMATRLERHKAFAHTIERRIREYQRQGIADRAIDPWFAAYALGGMVAAMAEHMFIDHIDDDIELAIAQLTTLWVNAIGLRPDPVAAGAERASGNRTAKRTTKTTRKVPTDAGRRG